MARRHPLPQSCAGWKKIKTPSFATARSMNTTEKSWYRKGTVILSCDWRSCYAFRQKNGRGNWTLGSHVSPGSLSHACSAITDTTGKASFGGLRRKRRSRR